MASKADQFYFDNFIEAAECACKAAGYLEECLKRYRLGKISDMLRQMHEYEHAGDLLRHEMIGALAKAFVTPVEREDLALISQNIDEVTDCIEEILQRFYMDQIRAVTPDALTFAGKLVVCCKLMKQLLEEFANFKKPAKLHEMIVELNRMEEECDHFYLEATMKIRREKMDVLDIIAWREIYDRMERCSDACEHVGDCVGLVVMKNT